MTQQSIGSVREGGSPRVLGRRDSWQGVARGQGHPCLPRAGRGELVELDCDQFVNGETRARHLHDDSLTPTTQVNARARMASGVALRWATCGQHTSTWRTARRPGTDRSTLARAPTVRRACVRRNAKLAHGALASDELTVQRGVARWRAELAEVRSRRRVRERRSKSRQPGDELLLTR
jgi:hypothetical protein